MPPTTVTSVVTPAVVTAPQMLAAGMLPSQNLLPQIPPYHGGEPKDGETFLDWLEHFEAVAQLA